VVSSTRFESEGSSSGRQMHVELRYSTFNMLEYQNVRYLDFYKYIDMNIKHSILLSTTNKLQRYTIFFIIVNALHVSVGFSAHHQELKNSTHNIGYMPSLAASKLDIYPMLCVQFLSS